jgi:hypothetical protein
MALHAAAVASAAAVTLEECTALQVAAPVREVSQEQARSQNERDVLRKLSLQD